MRKEHLQSKLRKRTNGGEAKPYRTKRERKICFGEMLQIDGSFHEWFSSLDIVDKKDRKACLLNIIDDNTNIIELMFDKEETMKCASLLLWKWVQKYGIPQSIYCDKRNMYITNRDINKGKTDLNNPKGYFRTMCDNLNIQIIQANSPQAKGRVERDNQTHQDRLVKLMRLKNITNIEEANKYLNEEYVEEHNKKFSLTPNINHSSINADASMIYMHRKLKYDITLNDVCYIEEIRKLRND
jgi:hypothetical protein